MEGVSTGVKNYVIIWYINIKTYFCLCLGYGKNMFYYSYLWSL